MNWFDKFTDWLWGFSKCVTCGQYLSTNGLHWCFHCGYYGANKK